MEVELAANTDPEEDFLEVDEENDISLSEAERCGICLDVIVDRGVLDCCDDWFCFPCIDNWASITNVCPLCQSEFQLITCVPVYDTIGSSNVEDDSFSVDEDWCIEGKSSTLSFPSYYIDENAVVCLDGDGCKIRSQSTTLEEDSNLDTSIACDSCDIWYHAFCVGFDPEAASENTWLCPRCVVDEMRGKTDMASLESCGPACADSGCMVDATFSRKVSVSVADAGETAVVVSMVGENSQADEPDENSCSIIEGENNLKTENLLLNSGANGEQIEMSVKEISMLPNSEVQKPDLSLSAVDFELKMMSSNKSVHEQSCLEGFVAPSEVSHAKDLPKFDNMHKNEIESQVIGAQLQCHPLDDHLSDSKIQPGATEDVSDTGVERKRKLSSDDSQLKVDDREVTAKTRAKVAKKIRAMDKSQMIPSKGLDIGKENAAADIFSIVRGTHRRTGSTDKASGEGGNETGLRVKKIMRRACENTGSSVLVQKLREEIRETVCHKSAATAALGRTCLDPKLLSAFRAAVAGPPTDPVEKISPSVVRAKKARLQKGRVRENLTRKIYGTENGRRRRAWDRDCEIEFWKHRSMGFTKPEKIETLKSVLNVLRGTEEAETQYKSEVEDTNPILSRLYIADTSVFPRKDDIKPLSTLDGDGNNCLTLQGKATSGKLHLNERPKVSSGSVVANSKGDSKKETVAKPGDRVDKRKWALEVLARKMESPENSTPVNKDFALLKGNHPLLTQLPVDMRPVLAPSRHNKIPISARQAQLYRLTEHFLRKANVSVTSRSAVTELAVADAINIEKEAADRSNSKLVYVNLCSQEILRHSGNGAAMESTETNLPVPSPSSDKSEQASIEAPDPLVEEALRTAGLLSDSPPNSPVLLTKMDEGTNNLFETSSHPKLDTCDDFPSLSHQKPEEGTSEIKPSVSTSKPDRSNHSEEVSTYSGKDEAPYERSNDPDKLSVGASSEMCKLVDAEPMVPGSGHCEENLTMSSQTLKEVEGEKISTTNNDKHFNGSSTVYKKVEAYIKEHIRPLCKSGVITVEQYRFSVVKATDKVMQHHSRDKTAKFLIKEGEKVKKLAEQYVAASLHREP